MEKVSDQEEGKNDVTIVSITSSPMSEQEGQQLLGRKTVAPAAAIEAFPWRIRAMQHTGESAIMTNQPSNQLTGNKQRNIIDLTSL